MKYLKTFEGFGHLDFDDELFKQINFENFEEMVSSRSLEKSCVSEEILDLDKKWFTTLIELNILNTKFSINEIQIVKRINSDNFNSVVRLKLNPKFNNDWTEILLYKFEDDYWVVECMGYGNIQFDGGSDWTYWACDTKQGVEDWCEYYFKTIKNSKLTESLSNEDLLYYEISDLNPDEKQEVKMDNNLINRIESMLLPGFSIQRNWMWCRIEYHKLADFYLQIFQLDDEWFDIEYLDARDKSYGKTMFNSHYYRCDGVEGLLQFLKDENIIA